MNKCPDPEQLAAYLEQQVSTSESQHLMAHFLECQICRKLIARVIKSESVVPGPSTFNKLYS
jgi:hypothetical protein